MSGAGAPASMATAASSAAAASIGAQMGIRAASRLRAEQFRLFLAMLILAVGARFAAEIVVRPADPFSVVRADARS